MPSSTPPASLLSPPLEVLPLRSRKSNSPADGRTDYFLDRNQQGVPTGNTSLLETPLPLSALFANVMSSAHSESESNYSNESNYLTPPQSQGDNDKPPYKARSESSASLNMSTGRIEDPIQTMQRTKDNKQGLNSKYTPAIEGNREHSHASTEYNCRLCQNTPDCPERGFTNVKSEHGSEMPRSFANRNGALRYTIMERGECSKNCVSQLASTVAAPVTSRRWSSVGIGIDDVPGRNSAMTKETDHHFSHNYRKRSNSLPNSHCDEKIMGVIRTRLKFHEASQNRQPTPATITLRRASRISTENNIVESIRKETDLKLHEMQAPATYLITTNDADLITNLIHSGFDVRKTTLDIPDRDCMIARKPSVTTQGLLPIPSGSAEVAVTNESIYQTPRVPRVSFGNSQTFHTNRVRDILTGQSEASFRRNVPEVIWEDTRPPVSPYNSSKASFSSGGQAELVEDSTSAHFLGELDSNSAQAYSRRTDTLGHRRCRSSDDGDNSPTSRVFQWVFREPSEEAVTPSDPDSQHVAPDEKPGSPAERNKIYTGPSRPLVRPDVISFPPLAARQFTTDWFSPLPDIGALPSSDNKGLHDSGTGTQVSRDTIHTKGSLIRVKEQSNLMKETDLARNSSTPVLESSSGRKSITILHPQVSPRLGDSFKIGNALGSSCGVRRKSSAKSVRLRITDEGLEHRFQETNVSWVKPRKDSGWPSRRSTSPEEPDSRRASHALNLPAKQSPGRFNSWSSKFGQI